jgi:hypothetical protein
MEMQSPMISSDTNKTSVTVMELIQPLLHKGYTIMMDVSQLPPLAKFLMLQKIDAVWFYN